MATVPFRRYESKASELTPAVGAVCEVDVIAHVERCEKNTRKIDR